MAIIDTTGIALPIGSILTAAGRASKGRLVLQPIRFQGPQRSLGA
jgi:hypothetical protein